MSVVRWPRAFTVSVIFHIVLLTVAGYMASALFLPPPVEEQLLELDLSSQPEELGTATVNNQPPAAPSAAPTVQQAVVRELQQSVAQAVAVAEAMSLEAVEPAVAGGNASAGSASGGGVADGTATASMAAAGGTGSAGQGQGGRNRGSISMPSILSKVEPRYPESARRSGQTGTVLLRIQILENGRPGSIMLVNSSGYEELDDAAMEAVQQWRFVPARDRDSGQALRCYTTLPVIFQIR